MTPSEYLHELDSNIYRRQRDQRNKIYTNAFCTKHGKVVSPLRRVYCYMLGVTVPDVLAYVCPICGEHVAIPHEQSYRVRNAVRNA